MGKEDLLPSGVEPSETEKTSYECTSCGHTVERTTPPEKCSQCGSTLFRLIANDEALAALQAYADENNILLPTDFNRTIRPQAGGQDDEEHLLPTGF